MSTRHFKHSLKSSLLEQSERSVFWNQNHNQKKKITYLKRKFNQKTIFS